MVRQSGRASLIILIPLTVSSAEPIYCSSPVPTGNTRGSKIISFGLKPCFSTSKSCERLAISTFRSAVTAMPVSSIVPTTRAAPNFFTSGKIASKRSSPSSKLMELIMTLPCEYVKAFSITFSSVESITRGTFTFFTTS